MRFLTVGSLFILLGCQTVKPMWSVKSVANESLRRTTEGEVVGGQGRFGGWAWLGVPFAEAPVGELRWRAPRPPPAREFPLAATNFQSACAQPVHGVESAKDSNQTFVGSEDCLYLNIWAPEHAQQLPVMVWIHGGDNTVGSATSFDGSKLASSQNVVVVSVQHRLGPLGWFRHAALRDGATLEEASGNFALLDLVRALEWLKANGTAFGGDIDRVTVFGQAAGATNVYALLLIPAARGLFHRAIAQSPTLSFTTLAQAEEYTAHRNSSAEVHLRYLLKHGARDFEDAKVKLELIPLVTQAEDLRALSLDELFSLYLKEPKSPWSGLQMPVLFPDGVVLPKENWLTVLTHSERWNQVPLLLGSNRDEFRLFQAYDDRLTYQWMGLMHRIREPSKYETMASISSRVWRASTVDAVIDAVSKSGRRDVWTYRFDWDDEADTWGKSWSKILGAAHGFEVPFLSGNFEDVAFPFEFSDPQGRDALSLRMMKQWATFAALGHPSSEWVSARSQPVVGSNVMTFDAPKDVVQSEENVGNTESILRGWLANREIPWADKCERLNEFEQMGLIGTLPGELAAQCGAALPTSSSKP